MSKARFLVSVRLNRDSYFLINPTLMKAMKRDQSYILNKATELGLVVLGADPKRVMDESEEVQAVIKAQGQIIRDLTARLEPKDREALEVKA